MKGPGVRDYAGLAGRPRRDEKAACSADLKVGMSATDVVRIRRQAEKNPRRVTLRTHRTGGEEGATLRA